MRASALRGLPLLFSLKTSGQRPWLFDKGGISLTRLTGNELSSSESIGVLRAQAARTLRDLPAGGLKNNDTGWRFTVSYQDWKKIATAPGQTDAGLRAVGGIKLLVERAILAESHTDMKGNLDVVAVHRFYAPAVIGERFYRAKLTVREYAMKSGEERKNLHALEAVEIEGAPPGIIPAHESLAETQQAQPTTGHTLSIADLLRGAIRDDGQPFTPDTAPGGPVKGPQAPMYSRATALPKDVPVVSLKGGIFAVKQEVLWRTANEYLSGSCPTRARAERLARW